MLLVSEYGLVRIVKVIYPFSAKASEEMSFSKSYEAAEASYKPLTRSQMARSTKPMKRGTKPLKRSRMKPHRITPEETAWRNEVLKNSGYQCQWVDQQTGERCRVRGAENLDAHHINERSQRPDLVLDLSNGAALCSGLGRHHDRAHHTVEGRMQANAQGLLGGTTYELAKKQIDSRSQ
jgi:hypothetical protein